MKIESVYRELNERHVCKSGYEFSRRFLGKGANYYSVLKARGKEPSVEALVTLTFALQQREQYLTASDNKFVRDTAARLTAMREVITENMRQACVAKDQ